MTEGKTAQERLIDAFEDRPIGMLGNSGMLAFLWMILHSEHGFCGRLDSVSDFRGLSDELAELVLQYIPLANTPRDPNLALCLVAHDVSGGRNRG